MNFQKAREKNERENLKIRIFENWKRRTLFSLKFKQFFRLRNKLWVKIGFKKLKKYFGCINQIMIFEKLQNSKIYLKYFQKLKENSIISKKKYRTKEMLLGIKFKSSFIKKYLRSYESES